MSDTTNYCTYASLNKIYYCICQLFLIYLDCKILFMETSSQKQWPIHPQFLSLCESVGEHEYSPNLHGIFESDTLRGFMADASDDSQIKNPLSLFQVVPAECTFGKSIDSRIEALNVPDNSFLRDILRNRKIIRIDPQGLFPNMKCCDEFRACNDGLNKFKCFDLDSQILILFHDDLSKIHYENDFIEYVAKLNELCDRYNATLANNPGGRYSLHVESDPECGRLYVWYQCRYSRLYEYFFPVIHSGKVIAVLMHGQRFHCKLTKEELFREFRGEKRLEASIEQIQLEEFDQEPMSSSREEAIFRRISLLEKRIDKEVLQYARERVSREFRKIETRFRNDIRTKIDRTGNITLGEYSEVLNSALQRICEFFNPDGFIRIYTAESLLEEIDKNLIKFHLIGTSDASNDEPVNRIVTFRGITRDQIDSKQNKELARFAQQTIELEELDTFRIENLLVGGMKNLIWKSYSAWKINYIKQFDLYANSLVSMYHTLLEPYNILRNVELQLKLETSMRVSVHEAANIIPVIISALSKEYDFNAQTLERAREGMSRSQINARERVLYDSIQHLLLLDNLYRSSTLIFKEDNPRYDWTDLHRAVYGIETLFSEDAFLNNRQRIVVEMDPELNKFDFLTDIASFSHILFNLVDNAVKYGLRGSNIYIRVVVPSDTESFLHSGHYDKIDKLQISVVNYGFEIKPDIRNKIFELNFRSEQSLDQEGRGIGLFLVKKLCGMLSYKIENSRSALVAKCHAPAQYYFLQQHPEGELLNRLSEEIRNALGQKLPDNTISRIVNIRGNMDWRIGPREITSLLLQETYENIFTLTIKNAAGEPLLKSR